MKSIVFLFFCLIGFSSCVFYHDVVNKNSSNDIYVIYKDEKSKPLFSSGVMNYYCERGNDISTLKLSYLFKAHNIRWFDNHVIEFHSFSFTNKNGDTLPCTFYYNTNSYITRHYILDSTFIKIDTLPFSFDIKNSNVFNVLVETEQLYCKTKKVYVSFDITVNNQRITKNKIKYKWKLCMKRLI